jgi:hypothetical protein
MSKILLDNRFLLIAAILVTIALPVLGFDREVRQASPQQSNAGWLNNTMWEYPGGDMKPSRIIFRSDGQLVFEVEFTELNPSYWHYNDKERELSFILPNVSHEMLNNRVKRGRGQVKRVELDKRTLIYDFDNKTEVFDFMGWNYFKKREY